jgi:hypothetical protein
MRTRRELPSPNCCPGRPAAQSSSSNHTKNGVSAFAEPGLLSPPITPAKNECWGGSRRVSTHRSAASGESRPRSPCERPALAVSVGAIAGPAADRLCPENPVRAPSQIRSGPLTPTGTGRVGGGDEGLVRRSSNNRRRADLRTESGPVQRSGPDCFMGKTRRFRDLRDAGKPVE